MCTDPRSLGGTCLMEVNTLLLSAEESRVLAVGRGATVSPRVDHIAFVDQHGVW